MNDVGKGMPTYVAVKRIGVGRDTYPAEMDTMPNYRRYYIPGHAVFVTVVTRGRAPWFADARRVDLLLGAMRGIRERRGYRQFAYVVLPDHFHWMFMPNGNENFSKFVASVKREVTWRLKDSGLEIGAGIWQSRFYDHVIRDDDDFARHLDYVHYNPVKHGMTSSAVEYAHSSFLEWSRLGVYATDWGVTERAPRSVEGMNLE